MRSTRSIKAMTSYQFLCPRCGHGFQEGTSFSKCPECQVPLLHASPAEAAPQPVAEQATDAEPPSIPDLFQAAQSLAVDLLKSPPPLGSDGQTAGDRTDLAALVREALSQQQPQEVIDAAIERLARRDYPQHADLLQRSIGELLDTVQRGRDLTRQQAAEQLAKSNAEIQVGPHGETGLRVVFPTVFHVAGVNELSDAQRADIEKQLADFLKSGKPISTTRIVVPKVQFKAGCAGLLFIGLVLLAGGVVFFA